MRRLRRCAQVGPVEPQGIDRPSPLLLAPSRACRGEGLRLRVWATAGVQVLKPDGHSVSASRRLCVMYLSGLCHVSASVPTPLKSTCGNSRFTTDIGRRWSHGCLNGRNDRHARMTSESNRVWGNCRLCAHSGPTTPGTTSTHPPNASRQSSTATNGGGGATPAVPATTCGNMSDAVSSVRVSGDTSTMSTCIRASRMRAPSAVACARPVSSVCRD